MSSIPNYCNVDGQILRVVFKVAVAALSFGGEFSASGLPLPTAATAGQTFDFAWQVSSSTWFRTL